MAKKLKTGICALCLQDRVLCKSHYLGRAIHRLAGLNNDVGQIILTPKILAASPRHLVGHLLCGECEQRFNKLGEAPVLQLLNRGDSFPLFERMKLALDIGRSGDATVFSGSDMGIDTTALAYFALSLAWRGSVRKWGTLKGQTTGISLGKYQQPIRSYLAGESTFPRDVSVTAAVCSDAGSQLMVNAPWLVETDDKHLQIEILVRGLWFHVLAGTGVPDRYMSLCLMRSPKHPIFLANFSEQFLLMNKHFFECGRRSGGGTDRPQTPTLSAGTFRLWQECVSISICHGAVGGSKIRLGTVFSSLRAHFWQLIPLGSPTG